MEDNLRIRQDFCNLDNPSKFQVDLNTLTITSKGEFTLTCMDAEEWLFRVEFDGILSEDRLHCNEGGEWEIWLGGYNIACNRSLSGALKTLSGLYQWRSQSEPLKQDQ